MTVINKMVKFELEPSLKCSELCSFQIQKMLLLFLFLFFRLDPDVDSAFWDFDLETASMGDLTATLDYVFNVTASERVFYICHSMVTFMCPSTELT